MLRHELATLGGTRRSRVLPADPPIGCVARYHSFGVSNRHRHLPGEIVPPDPEVPPIVIPGGGNGGYRLANTMRQRIEIRLRKEVLIDEQDMLDLGPLIMQFLIHSGILDE